MLYDIHLPKVLELSKKDNTGVYAIEPLYPGFGMTLGNSLRRVILSSLSGSAVTAVKIEGVPHEFGAIPGVKEDIVEVILNLKQLRLKLHGEGPEILTLSGNGSKKLTAKDIETPSSVEIVNKDLHLAELSTDKAKLSMEIRVERGRGYVPVEERDGERLEVGMIAVDAIYTPIKKIRYNVENTRVGQMTNLDKLVIEIETDGTIDPEEALRSASEVLVDHFGVVSGKQKELTEEAAEEGKIPEDKAGKVLIEEISLTPRTTNALLNNNIKTIADVRSLSDGELKTLKGFGNKAYEELKEKLLELGFAENEEE